MLFTAMSYFLCTHCSKLFSWRSKLLQVYNNSAFWWHSKFDNCNSLQTIHTAIIFKSLLQLLSLIHVTTEFKTYTTMWLPQAIFQTAFPCLRYVLYHSIIVVDVKSKNKIAKVLSLEDEHNISVKWGTSKVSKVWRQS